VSTSSQLYGALDGPPPDPILITPIQDTGGTTQSYPFDCTLSGSDLTVQYGTINSLEPYNINTTFNTGGASNFYVLLSMTTSNAQITLAGISISASPATIIPVTLGQPPVSFQVPIAVCSSGTIFRAIGPGSLVATPYEVYRLVKAMATPDALPFDSYYSWRLGLA
jgi:hypothetical protein